MGGFRVSQIKRPGNVKNCRENGYVFFNPPPRMVRGRGGREGGDRQGEREREAGREGGARAKPGNQLVYYIKLQCPFVCLSVCTPPPFSDTAVGPQQNLAHIFG